MTQSYEPIERRNRDRPVEEHAERNALVEEHRALARSLARRFAGRGEPLEDLEQVALLATIKAADRFEPDRNISFSTFATATVLGELKRHFRDRRWTARVGRGSQERYLRVRDATDELTVRLGRAPTPQEVADECDLTVDEVLAARETSAAMHVGSLNAPGGVGGGRDGDGTDHVAALGREDQGFRRVEANLAVSGFLDRLTPRERLLLRLRFVERLSQAEIGLRLGMSQMHVSRLLAATLKRIRSWTDD